VQIVASYIRFRRLGGLLKEKGEKDLKENVKHLPSKLLLTIYEAACWELLRVNRFASAWISSPVSS